MACHDNDVEGNIEHINIIISCNILFLCKHQNLHTWSLFPITWCKIICLTFSSQLIGSLWKIIYMVKGIHETKYLCNLYSYQLMCDKLLTVCMIFVDSYHLCIWPTVPVWAVQTNGAVMWAVEIIANEPKAATTIMARTLWRPVKNLQVCNIHFSLVWKTMVGRGVITVCIQYKQTII